MPSQRYTYDNQYAPFSLQDSFEQLERRRWERRMREAELERFSRANPSLLDNIQDPNTPDKDVWNDFVQYYFEHARRVLATFDPAYIESILNQADKGLYSERVLGLHGMEVRRADDGEWSATIR